MTSRNYKIFYFKNFEGRGICFLEQFLPFVSFNTADPYHMLHYCAFRKICVGFIFEKLCYENITLAKRRNHRFLMKVNQLQS